LWEESTPEEEEEVIERIARYIVNKRLELPAGILLLGLSPFTFIGAQWGRFFLSPYLSALGGMGEDGNRVISTFEKRSNVKKLRERIEELTIEYDLAEKKLKEERDSSSMKKKGSGIRARLKRLRGNWPFK